MAIKLTAKENVEAASGPYPYGKIKDDTGIGDGTPINEQVYGDIHQFFEKMMDAAGVVHNGNPENLTTGFQFFEALQKVVLDFIKDEDWHRINNFEYRKSKDGFVYTRGYVKYNETITLPVGYRPASEQIIHCSGSDQSSVATNNIYATINTDGTVTSPFFGTGPTNLFLAIVITSFKIA
ncbi:MAG: hypothetical protein U0T32_11990 [Chitinophagales bacterium]